MKIIIHSFINCMYQNHLDDISPHYDKRSFSLRELCKSTSWFLKKANSFHAWLTKILSNHEEHIPVACRQHLHPRHPRNHHRLCPNDCQDKSPLCLQQVNCHGRELFHHQYNLKKKGSNHNYVHMY